MKCLCGYEGKPNVAFTEMRIDVFPPRKIVMYCCPECGIRIEKDGEEKTDQGTQE